MPEPNDGPNRRSVYIEWPGPGPGFTMKIGQIEIPEPCRLAPMAAISDAPFRVISKECGPAGVRGPADRIFLS